MFQEMKKCSKAADMLEELQEENFKESQCAEK